MIAAACQRATPGGGQRFRPAGERIDPRAYYVEAIPDDTTARAFILAHHYEGSFPAARFRYGLRRRTGELVGVAVLSYPWQHVVAAAGLPFASAEVVELSRFVLLDEVPGNGESWFLAQVFGDLAARATAVLSFSDPLPRRDAGGALSFRGHIGTIYQATNARFVGSSSSRAIHLLPDGRVLSDRLATKIRLRERGWRAGVDMLVGHGAPPPPDGCLRSWLAEVRGRLTRRVRHPGCYRYVWALGRRDRRHLPAAQPYPKALAVASLTPVTGTR